LTIKGRVTIEFDVTGERDLNAETDKLFRALLAVEEEDSALSGADVMVELASQIVTTSIVVEAGSWSQAEERAFKAFSDAIERAGGNVVPGTYDSGLQELSLPAETPSNSGHLHASIRTTELVPV
jgi:hypothetical protein